MLCMMINSLIAAFCIRILPNGFIQWYLLWQMNEQVRYRIFSIKILSYRYRNCYQKIKQSLNWIEIFVQFLESLSFLIWTWQIQNKWTICPIYLSCISEKKPHECQKTSLMRSRHWFRWCLGATRHQAITWTNVDQLLWHQVAFPINSLRPSDDIWWHRSLSTSAQVMACCLTAPSHYLNQCWLTISKV